MSDQREPAWRELALPLGGAAIGIWMALVACLLLDGARVAFLLTALVVFTIWMATAWLRMQQIRDRNDELAAADARAKAMLMQIDSDLAADAERLKQANIVAEPRKAEPGFLLLCVGCGGALHEIDGLQSCRTPRCGGNLYGILGEPLPGGAPGNDYGRPSKKEDGHG